MEYITSRKNELIKKFKKLQSDAKFRTENSLFVCEGFKMLEEAINCSVEIDTVIWNGDNQELDGNFRSVIVPSELYEYISTMKNSPGPIFTVKIKEQLPSQLNNAIVLDGVQDPGNVGTIIRTANAFKIDAVILTGNCADIYNPKTIRATMGAIFRQTVFSMENVADYLHDYKLELLGAALSEESIDIRNCDLTKCAIAIGSEGKGISKELLNSCDKKIIIPMNTESESLNAAIAASIVMWELNGKIL